MAGGHPAFATSIGLELRGLPAPLVGPESVSAECLLLALDPQNVR